MDEDFDIEADVWRPDIVVQRCDALRDLAAQVDATRDKKAREILLRAMDRVADFLVEPKDNIRELKNG